MRIADRHRRPWPTRTISHAARTTLRAVYDWIRGPGATAAALLLAAILTWAAGAKLRSRRQTEADFTSLGLVAAAPLAVAVPVAELVAAALLVTAPGWGGALAAALVVGFSVVIVRVLRHPGGLTPTCACFGGSSHRPLSYHHLVRNGVLLLLALIAASFSGGMSPIFGFVLY